MRTIRMALIPMLLLLVALPVHAGRSCQEFKPDPVTVYKALQLALATREVLDASGAQVALVGRVGRDMSKHGLRYSHMAIALRDHPKGRWHLTHMLNECGTAVSNLYDEGLGNFFLDDVFAFEAIVMVPSPVMQAPLKEHLLAAVEAGNKPPLPVRLHESRYSLIAHPFSTQYQNSNQWVLELLMAASLPPNMVAGRHEAQAWLRSGGYAPSEITITPAERFGARLFAANVSFVDHTPVEMQTGRYLAVTVESVLRFMEQWQVIAQQRVVKLPESLR